MGDEISYEALMDKIRLLRAKNTSKPVFKRRKSPKITARRIVSRAEKAKRTQQQSMVALAIEWDKARKETLQKIGGKNDNVG